MHARIDDLLSVRDGEPVEASIARHVRECAACAAQLEHLSRARGQLQNLPLVDARASWRVIQRRMHTPQPRVRWPHLAAASGAAAVLALCISLFVQQQSTREVATESARSFADPAPLDELTTRSQMLESMLASLPERPRIERVSTAATIDTLEQRIQWLDEQLSYAPEAALTPEHSQQLWRERVALMDSLVKVRYAEAQRLNF